MASTWEDNIARSEPSIIVWAEIKGVGDKQGLWRFSDSEGWSLGTGEGTWKPYLIELPDILGEKAPFLIGGAVKSDGGVSLNIADIDGEVTDMMAAVDRGRISKLSAAVTDSATSFTVPDGTAFTVDGTYWIGSEAIVVEAIVSNTLTVARGQLGTAGRAHIIGAPLFARPQYMQHRELTLYVAPLDGSENAKQVVGVYTIESLPYDDTHASLIVSAGSRDPYLARRVPRLPEETRVSLVLIQGESRQGRAPDDYSSVTVADRLLRPLSSAVTQEAGSASLPQVILGSPNSDELLAFLWSDSLPGMRTQAWQGTGDYRGRGHAGSVRDDLPEVGTVMRRVMSVANGDFAYGTGTDRSTGWTAVGKDAGGWIEVLLCILLSPATEGETATNFDASSSTWSGRNWSGLVPGYGCGVPYTIIDFDSFQRVAADPAGLNFPVPNFTIGREIRLMSEIVDELLQPSGCFLMWERGQITLVAPTLIAAGDTPSYAVNDGTVLMKGSLPSIRLSQVAGDLTEVRVTFSPQERELVQSWADRSALFDPLDYYEIPGVTLDITSPGSSDAQRETLTALAQRHLSRGYRPRLQADVELPLSFWAALIGDYVTVDVTGVADYAGNRDLSGDGLVQESELSLDNGAYFRARLLVSPSLAVGKVSPAALITAVSGDTATVVCNLFTDTDGETNLPNGDGVAFTAGDVVRQVDASGVDTGGGTQIVVDSGEIESLTFTNALQVNGAGTTTTVPPSATAQLQVHVYGTNTSISDASTSVTYGGVSASSENYNVHRFGVSSTRGWQYCYVWTAADVATRSGNSLAVTSGLTDVMYLIRWIDGDLNTAPGGTELRRGQFAGPSWAGSTGFVLTASDASSLFEGALWLGGFMTEGPNSVAYTEGQKTPDGPFYPAGSTYKVETAYALKAGTNPDRIDATASGDTGNSTDQGNTIGVIFDRNSDSTGSGCFIELDGDFSGSLAADDFLIYADSDEDAAQQSASYVTFDDDWVFG